MGKIVIIGGGFGGLSAALDKYHPRDSGYIIPMANNRSCGRVLGLDLKGLLPTIFHFIISIWCSYGFKNK